MKRKFALVILVFWLVAGVGGGVSDHVNRLWQRWRTPSGLLEVATLRDLYASGMYEELLEESIRAQTDRRFANQMPEVLYWRWLGYQRLGRSNEAHEVEGRFLNEFAHDKRAASIHFSRAMDRIARSEYGAAAKEFSVICNEFPHSAIAPEAREMLSRFSETAYQAGT